VNPDVDGCKKALHIWKILRKAQKNNNLMKTKRILKPKYKLSGRPVFTVSLPVGGGAIRPSGSPQFCLSFSPV